MKALHPITCAAPMALLLLSVACQAPVASQAGDSDSLMAQPSDPALAQVPGTSAAPDSEAKNGAMAAENGPPGGQMKAQPASTAPQGDSEMSSLGKDEKASPKPKAKRPAAETLAKQLTEAKEGKVHAAREQRYAEAELEIAEMAAAGTEIDAVESLRSARADLEAAEEALALFDAEERPLEVAKAEVSVADAEERLLTAETDLLGLEDIFAEEAEASAKPEILRRGRRKVERAKLSVEMAKKEAALTIEHELPARLKELSREVRAKESGLRSAQNAAAKDRRSAELSVEKATDEADAKKREAKKKAAKVNSLQKRVNDARQKGQGTKNAAPKSK